jgi:hypothetical protein
MIHGLLFLNVNISYAKMIINNYYFMNKNNVRCVDQTYLNSMTNKNDY